jgi:PKD repeat protein
MSRIMNSTWKHSTVRGLLLAVCIISLAMQPFAASPALAATTIPVLWTAGGLSAGTDSAGQAARIASDASGNIAVVSGPSGGRDLAVTSYTATGSFRWRSTVTPAAGTFVGDWVVAAPNGDFVAIGHNQDSHGRPIASTMLRYGSNGTLLWRIDFSSGFYPSVARLVIDAAGNAYVAWSAVGNGFLVQKYSTSGALLWSQGDSTGSGYAVASSLALSPDGGDVAVTGSVSGGATWITAVYNTTTGVRRWQVTAAEGIAALDVIVDATRVYVTGQGNVGINGFLTVVAYDRATGTRQWRTDANPPTCCAIGQRIALAPDGSLVVAGRTATGGYFDWWIVAMNSNGTVRWLALRDAALSGDEFPTSIFVLADGTTVVSGTGGPVTHDILGNSYMQGVTAGYSSNGTLLWEAFSKLGTVWATPLPNGDVCATGGYDALITCWRVSGSVPLNQPPTAVMSVTPSSGTSPLTVTFDGSGSTDPDGSVVSWIWSFGDGYTGTGAVITHTYTMSGMTYTPSLTVVDNRGGSSRITGSDIVVNAPPPPSAPSLLAASISGASVVLTWKDNSSNETAFYIERCEGTGCISFTGLGGTSANVSTYTDSPVTAGTTYRYRVTASNDGGFSSYSNIASIVVGVVNQPPTAVISATPTTGAAPLTVTFSSAGSSDSDGTIASYSWNFGDGTTSTIANPGHTYAGTGSYIASLTVTDNAGATASASASITVTPSTVQTLRSTAINLSGTRLGSRVTVTGQVVVRDAANAGVSGVSVNVTWSRPDGTSVTQTAMTGNSGNASFNTSGGRGTYSLTVNNLTKTGYTFDKVNSVLSKSIIK